MVESRPLKKVYVSGAYSAPTSQGVLDNCVHAAHHAILIAKGGGHPILPHLSHPHAATYDEAMALCKSQLLGCQAIYLIHGWESSPGAVQERDWAVSLGLPVFKTPGEVQAWIRGVA